MLKLKENKMTHQFRAFCTLEYKIALKDRLSETKEGEILPKISHHYHSDSNIYHHGTFHLQHHYMNMSSKKNCSNMEKMDSLILFFSSDITTSTAFSFLTHNSIAPHFLVFVGTLLYIRTCTICSVEMGM